MKFCGYFHHTHISDLLSTADECFFDLKVSGLKAFFLPLTPDQIVTDLDLNFCDFTSFYLTGTKLSEQRNTDCR